MNLSNKSAKRIAKTFLAVSCLGHITIQKAIENTPLSSSSKNNPSSSYSSRSLEEQSKINKKVNQNNKNKVTSLAGKMVDTLFEELNLPDEEKEALARVIRPNKAYTNVYILEKLLPGRVMTKERQKHFYETIKEAMQTKQQTALIEPQKEHLLYKQLITLFERSLSKLKLFPDIAPRERKTIFQAAFHSPIICKALSERLGHPDALCPNDQKKIADECTAFERCRDLKRQERGQDALKKIKKAKNAHCENVKKLCKLDDSMSFFPGSEGQIEL